jgi:flagellar hook-associated protein 2
MGLKFDPMGGGQFKQLVAQIIEAEKQPLKQLEARKKVEDAKMKLFQEFKGKFTGFEKTLNEFSNFRKFRELKVDLGDGENVISVTVDKERAEPGSYSLTVESLATRTSAISNGFENPDSADLGNGFIVVDGPEGAMEIYVDAKNSSLRGIANAINRTKNSPVQASVVQDETDPDAPWRLILTAKADGAKNQLTIPEFYFLDGNGEFYFDDSRDAENALIVLDGFEIESPSNDIKDFLTGVNLHLKGARPDRPVTFTISEDYKKVAGKVKGLVDQLNGILEFINKQNQVDERSDTKTMFTGDSSLNSIEYRLRNIIHEGFPVEDANADDGVRYKFLNQIGITFTKAGNLEFSEEKFQKALEDDFNGVSEMITGEFGLANQMKVVVENFTRTGTGLLVNRENAIKSRIRKIDDDITRKERRIEQKTQAVTDQFARLQGTLANMQRQQNYLSASMGAGGNPISQLLG